MSLNISPVLSLPLSSATWVISYLAKRGAGKTYCAAIQAEEMIKNKIPIVVLDGMSTWWGLRVSSDGLHEGLPIVVFGGEHADLPLVPEKAGEMARAVVESNINCVLDLSPFSKYIARKIVKDFLNELYRLNRVERHVFIEEADLWAPQRPIGPEENLCLSSVDNFVRRGGNHNLGCTLITQRSAVLNKDILTQSDCLVVLRTLAPQDKKAIQAWVEEQTEEDKSKLNKWYDTLKQLENGEAWVWHPEKPAIFQKVKFRQRETFHATREFIRSPRASKIVLMGVEEFIERFSKVFEFNPDGKPASTKDSVDRSLSEQVEKLKSEIRFVNSEHARIMENMTKELQTEAEDNRKLLLAAAKDREKIQGLEKQNAGFKKLKEALTEILPVCNAPGLTLKGSSVGLQRTTTIIDLDPAEKLVTISTDSMRGKILSVAKKGKLDQWRRLDEIVKALQDEHWNATPQEVNNTLNDLEKQDLIAKKHTDRNYYCLGQGVRFQEVV